MILNFKKALLNAGAVFSITAATFSHAGGASADFEKDNTPAQKYPYKRVLTCITTDREDGYRYAIEFVLSQPKKGLAKLVNGMISVRNLKTYDVKLEKLSFRTQMHHNENKLLSFTLRQMLGPIFELNNINLKDLESKRHAELSKALIPVEGTLDITSPSGKRLSTSEISCIGRSLL